MSSKKAVNTGTGTFGNPKPLPGQAGYKVTETMRLEQDTVEMEHRLKILQEKMQQQQLTESAKTSKPSSGSAGSGQWRSARTDKGSMRAYGKDVQEKHKRKAQEAGSATGTNFNMSMSVGANPNVPRREASMQKATAGGRRSSREEATADYKSKGVEKWSVSDVGDWLSSVHLSQYVEIFAKNEISGAIFVDLALEDLDYMEIKVLAHRKILLKGAQELRKIGNVPSGINVNGGLGPRTRSESNIADPDTVGRHDQQAEAKYPDQKERELEPKPEPEVQKTHWSHLEPLSSSTVSGEYGDCAVNAADGGGANSSSTDPPSILDEEAERIAFMEAVKEWRKGDAGGTASAAAAGTGKIQIVREYESKLGDSGLGGGGTGGTQTAGGVGAKSGRSDGGGLWHNPFSSTEDGSTSSHSASVLKAGSGVGVGAGRAIAMDDSDGEGDGPAVLTPKGAMNKYNNSNNGNTVYTAQDEEHEHAEFRKAVDAWRRGPSSSLHDQSNTAGSGSRPGTGSAGQVKIVKMSQSDGAQAGGGSTVPIDGAKLALELAHQLEREQAEAALKIEQQRAAAEERLQKASFELEMLRKKRLTAREAMETARKIEDAESAEQKEADEERMLPRARQQPVASRPSSSSIINNKNNSSSSSSSSEKENHFSEATAAGCYGMDAKRVYSSVYDAGRGKAKGKVDHAPYTYSHPPTSISVTAAAERQMKEQYSEEFFPQWGAVRADGCRDGDREPRVSISLVESSSLGAASSTHGDRQLPQQDLSVQDYYVVESDSD